MFSPSDAMLRKMVPFVLLLIARRNANKSNVVGMGKAKGNID